jgi:hypothetical protein
MLEAKRRVIGQMIVCQGCCCAAPSHSNELQYRRSVFGRLEGRLLALTRSQHIVLNPGSFPIA